MLAFSYKVFTEARIIKNFKSLKHLVDQAQLQKDFFLQADNQEFMWSLTQESLLDSIKISICFENYVKSALISQGFIVHKIDGKISNKKYKLLHDQQKEKPVLISELKNHEPFSARDIGSQNIIESLENYTLGLNFILHKPQYMKYVQEIDQDLAAIIKEFYGRRNSLHFNIGGSILFIGPDYITTLSKLIDFVNSNIVDQRNLLVESFKSKHDSPLHVNLGNSSKLLPRLAV